MRPACSPRWLAISATRPNCSSALQALLDQYRDKYNTRKNTVLGGLIPTEHADLGPFSGPDG